MNISNKSPEQVRQILNVREKNFRNKKKEFNTSLQRTMNIRRERLLRRSDEVTDLEKKNVQKTNALAEELRKAEKELEEAKELKKKMIKIQRGLKTFIINGQEIIALNKESAKKKFTIMNRQK